jgi:hypothetical protein
MSDDQSAPRQPAFVQNQIADLPIHLDDRRARDVRVTSTGLRRFASASAIAKLIGSPSSTGATLRSSPRSSVDKAAVLEIDSR